MKPLDALFQTGAAVNFLLVDFQLPPNDLVARLGVAADDDLFEKNQLIFGDVVIDVHGQGFGIGRSPRCHLRIGITFIAVSVRQTDRVLLQQAPVEIFIARDLQHFD